MKKQLLFTALVAVLLAGCAKDNSAQREDTTPGREVSVTLPFDVVDPTDTPTTPMSQSATMPGATPTKVTTPSEGFSVSFGESEQDQTTPAPPLTRTLGQALTNVWVLLFDASGKNVKTTNTGTLAAGAFLTPTLIIGSGYTICVVANGPASGLSTSSPATLTEFETKMLHTAAVTDAAALPISGKLTNVTVIDLGDGKGVVRLLDGTSLMIVLRRIHAEVTLKVDCAVTDYTLTGAKLYNVPVGATYGWNNATGTFPDNTVAANFGYTSRGMTPISTTTEGTKKVYKWFTGDNRRGEVPGVTAQDQRSKAKAPAYATFAQITLTGTSKTLLYDVYLGSGTVTSFDVLRNHTYTLTATIKGQAIQQESLVGVDARVSFGTPPPPNLTDDPLDNPFNLSAKETESKSMIVWGPTVSIPSAQSVFDGKANTDVIMAINATAYPAAKYCRDLDADYYLPSQGELMMMWIYLMIIPTTERPASDNFWSSTEDSRSNAFVYCVNFLNGTVGNNKKEGTCYVRCVREP